MAQLTPNNQKELRSRNRFKAMLEPWDCMRPEYDTDIDFVVQPYIGEMGFGTKRPFGRRFLVQLKSTVEIKLKVGANHAKISLSVKDLRSWQNQKDSVMIARYCITNDCFFYTWAKLVAIKNPKFQQVKLANKLLLANQDFVKSEIIKFISPPIIDHFEYQPAIPPLQPSVSITSIKVEGVKEGIFEYLTPVLDEAERRHYSLDKISELEAILMLNPRDELQRINLVLVYLYRKEIPQARIHLSFLIANNSWFAKIISRILDAGNEEILASLPRIKLVPYLSLEIQMYEGDKVAVRIYQDKTLLHTAYANFDFICLPASIRGNLNIQLEVLDRGLENLPIVWNSIRSYLTIQIDGGIPLREYAIELESKF